MASGDEADTEALPISADARVLGATLKAGQTAELRLGPGRRAYLVPATGAVEVDGVRVGPRDGAAISEVETLQVKALEDAEIVVVDVA
jgi:redox-sensitive bicupin YhaK (pirin superfamily)